MRPSIGTKGLAALQNSEIARRCGIAPAHVQRVSARLRRTAQGSSSELAGLSEFRSAKPCAVRHLTWERLMHLQRKDGRARPSKDIPPRVRKRKLILLRASPKDIAAIRDGTRLLAVCVGPDWIALEPLSDSDRLPRES